MQFSMGTSKLLSDTDFKIWCIIWHKTMLMVIPTRLFQFLGVRDTFSLLQATLKTDKALTRSARFEPKLKI